GSLRLKGKIEGFNPGLTGEVIALNDDENQGRPLSRFQSAIVMTALGGMVRRRDINVDLDQLNLPGFRIQSVSPLDPTGWAGITLVRPVAPPLPPPQPAQDAQPGAPGAPPTGVATTAATAPAGVPVAAGNR